jgi:hypothetical protein
VTIFRELFFISRILKYLTWHQQIFSEVFQYLITLHSYKYYIKVCFVVFFY